MINHFATTCTRKPMFITAELERQKKAGKIPSYISIPSARQVRYFLINQSKSLAKDVSSQAPPTEKQIALDKVVGTGWC